MDEESDRAILAQEVGAALVDVDRQLLAFLGIELMEISPGRAVCQMPVRSTMVNSHGFCQGGLIFALADQALAYAAMSGNNAGVTLSAHIIYSQPALLGARLTATAELTVDGGRTATCQVQIVNEADKVIADFQGVVYRLNRSVLTAPPPAEPD